MSGSSRRIVLDIVCVFSNVIKGMCNRLAVSSSVVARTTTCNAVIEPAAR